MGNIRYQRTAHRITSAVNCRPLKPSPRSICPAAPYPTGVHIPGIPPPAKFATEPSLVPSEIGDLAQRLDFARRDLPGRRIRLEGMNQAIFLGREVVAHQATYSSAEAAAQREQARASLATARAALVSARADVDRALRAYDLEARANEI